MRKKNTRHTHRNTHTERGIDKTKKEEKERRK